MLTSFRYGLVDRISGFHPADPSSIFGDGFVSLLYYFYRECLKKLYVNAFPINHLQEKKGDIFTYKTHSYHKITHISWNIFWYFHANKK